MQLHIIDALYEKLGYKNRQFMAFHKLWKNDKRPHGGLISATLVALVGYKNMRIMEHATLPDTTGHQGAIDRLKLLQNTWHLPNPAKATYDIHGDPINECPQSHVIPENWIKMLSAYFGKELIVFSSGESSGWVAPVCVKLGVNCVCTEPDPVSFHYLEYNLLSKQGATMLEQDKKETFWRRVRSYSRAARKDSDLKQKRAAEITQTLEDSLVMVGIKDTVVAHVVF
jgi:hypothetical protein